MATKSIAVIGSLNIDFITRTPRLPEAGETLTATSFETGLGGKGANQAVACARLAAPGTYVSMVGNVGEDTFGSDYIAALQKEGIDAKGVKRVKGQKTGIANIIVEEESGENRILLSTGANHAFNEGIESAWDLVPREAGVCVFQLEIPRSVVLHNLHLARQRGQHVIFNPAPALQIPETSYQNIDTLVMNETEARLLVTSSSSSSVLELGPLLDNFLKLGVRDAVIITLGGKGVVYATASGKTGVVPARMVKVVDTTAAGDTFLGAYAARVAERDSENFDHEEALNFASLAASKTVERKGAMAAIPRLSEL